MKEAGNTRIEENSDKRNERTNYHAQITRQEQRNRIKALQKEYRAPRVGGLTREPDLT